MDTIIEYEPIIRVSIFVGLLIILAGVEFLIPLAKRRQGRARQWFTNLAVVLMGNLSLLILPLIAVGVAKYAADNAIGLLNIININYWAGFILSLLLLDLVIYGQHVLVHKVPILWRLHRMHHTELGLDVTSAIRFHPIEIIFSMLIKMSVVLLFGIPVVAVIVFEVVLNGLALFNHSNIKLPRWIETPLRKLIITPEVHWIHHSELVEETNSNFGFNLCIWDKIFGTYLDKPTLSYDEMQQGLPEFGFKKPLNLLELIISPFKNYPAAADEEKKQA